MQSLSFPHALCLAPMAGYTDLAMRMMCKEGGADLCVTEMISAKAVVYGDQKTKALAYIGPEEGPVALQLFGRESGVLAEAAGLLSAPVQDGKPPVMIDINMGCPVQKIYGNGEGSALMRSPALIEQLVSAVCRATPLPVSVKLRCGVDAGHINAVECALAAEEGGASLVTVHGRTRTQMYSGTVDREVIKNVKNALHIPVIANGDVVDGPSAIAMLRETGADGLAIGRGAVGRPYIFAQLRAAIEGGSLETPTPQARSALALLHLRRAIAQKGEAVAVRECRKLLGAYFFGLRGSAALRAGIHGASTYQEVEAAFAAAVTACAAP